MTTTERDEQFADRLWELMYAITRGDDKMPTVDRIARLITLHMNPEREAVHRVIGAHEASCCRNSKSVDHPATCHYCIAYRIALHKYETILYGPLS